MSQPPSRTLLSELGCKINACGRGRDERDAGVGLRRTGIMDEHNMYPYTSRETPLMSSVNFFFPTYVGKISDFTLAFILKMMTRALNKNVFLPSHPNGHFELVL